MFFKNFLVVDTDNLVSTFLNPIFVRTVELLFTKVKKTLHSYFGRPDVNVTTGLLHVAGGLQGTDTIGPGGLLGRFDIQTPFLKLL